MKVVSRFQSEDHCNTDGGKIDGLHSIANFLKHCSNITLCLHVYRVFVKRMANVDKSYSYNADVIALGWTYPIIETSQVLLRNIIDFPFCLHKMK